MRTISYLAWVLLGLGGYAQSPPRLVIGLVVDQMRADYLRRFVSPRSQGLGRLLREGIVFWNVHYTYFPTYTGPGHATIYTGAVPAHHGICANTWWDSVHERPYYCVEDTTVAPVGTAWAGARCSPRTLLATTITDELRYATRYKGKVFGLAIKDRSAILPGGRSANLALWFDTQSGNWVTSSYYASALPSWVEAFNARRLSDSLLKQPWRLAHSYACADESDYEGKLGSEPSPTFPHQAATYRDLIYTPAGNVLTLELAKAAILHESLGRDRHTDFLAISLSSPDLIGHLFGTESCELEDSYHWLDEAIADFLRFLERRLPAGSYLVFLTADHGAMPTPEALAERGLSAGRFPERALVQEAESLLHAALALPDTVRFIAEYRNQAFYFSRKFPLALRQKAAQLLKAHLLDEYGLIGVYTREELTSPGASYLPFARLQAGFYPARSGDVVVIYPPGFIESEGYTTGTTHGSIWTYDTHVPLIFWWSGIRSSAHFEFIPVTAIAPTLAYIMGTPLPSAAFSGPLLPVLEAWRVPVHFFSGEFFSP